LPDVVIITGTSASALRHATAASIDARWGTWRRALGRWPPSDARHVRRRSRRHARAGPPQARVFVAAECFAQGAEHTLTTILHEAATRWPMPRHQGGEPARQVPQPPLRRARWRAGPGQGCASAPGRRLQGGPADRPARAGYAAAIGDLDAAITLHLDTFRRRRCAHANRGTDDGQADGKGDTGASGERTFNRAKLTCACSVVASAASRRAPLPAHFRTEAA
jgi:hypothetical protein